MALSDTKNNNVYVKGAETSAEQTRIDLNEKLNNSMPNSNTDTDGTSNIPIMGFTGSGKFLNMASGAGSAQLTKFVEALKEIYKDQQGVGGYKISVIGLDREVKKKLAYSSVVVSVNKNNKVVYFLILLESTGDRKPMDATTIINEVNNSNRNPMQQRNIDVYVASDAIDNILNNEVVSSLKTKYNGNFSYYSADAVVIPYYSDEITIASIRPLASLAYNACAIESGVLNKEFRDINIATAKKESPTTFLKIDSNMFPTTLKDCTGKPVRADWQIELNAVSNNNGQNSMNLQNTKNTICRTAGFIDAIQDEFLVQTVPGAAPTTKISLRPHIILNEIETSMPTTGYAILAVVSSLVMVRPNMFLGVLAPKANDKIHEVGSLNLLTNLDNQQNGVGEEVDLRDPNLTSQELYGIIKRMFTLDPIFSVDIEAYGPETNFMSVFSAAASSGNTPERLNAKIVASKEIIKTVSWLTSGFFPDNFNPNDIFASETILVPEGRWTDKDGNVRDLKDVDASFIATVGKSVELLNKWALSNAPYSITGVDPYLAKVGIISKLIPNAEITGKSFRVTFSGKFISTLSSACAQAGFETRYDPEVRFDEQSNIGVLGDYLNTASVSQANANFARAYNTGGQNYQTQYNMGVRY